VAFDRDFANVKELFMRQFNKTAPYAIAGMSVGNEVQRTGLINDILDCDDWGMAEKLDAIGRL
jgi:hypothetical protein